MYEKVASAIVDYQINWRDYLYDRHIAVDAIETMTWVVTPNTMTIESSSANTTHTQVRVSGGEERTIYYLKCDIDTENGNRFSQTIEIVILDTTP